MIVKFTRRTALEQVRDSLRSQKLRALESEKEYRKLLVSDSEVATNELYHFGYMAAHYLRLAEELQEQVNIVATAIEEIRTRDTNRND